MSKHSPSIGQIQLSNNDHQMTETPTVDTSIFGNTHESFFEFAERRVADLKKKNKKLFENAVKMCPYSTKTDETDELNRYSRSLFSVEKKSCTVGSFGFHNNYGLTADRLFLVDPFTIGLISKSDSTLKLFNFNLYHKSLNHIRTKYFRSEVPADACADRNKHIFIVFPDQNKIAKYELNHSFISRYSSRRNKSQILFREVSSNRDLDFRPSTIACYDDHIYVSENPKNQVRIYDNYLRLVRIIYLNGVIVSNHRRLSLNQNVRVFMDGSDGLALFNPSLSNTITSHKKYSLFGERNRVNVCHFYTDMDCLEDVHVAAQSRTTSNIYTADSCSNEVKQFLFNNGEKIDLVNRYSINGRPISVVTNQLDYIFVLTERPRKIYILDPREC
ncbi:hypothetical protein BpHYR1_035420 [Brachionus plicatilis]|uniref:Uncharacterized protein n=1 Tax=Brachionus plicatilis TaxID=10195 RepID=A0A3M7QDY4_BRAPC|nr:hypothetical protein BpHYR1_035420 [Brachionus plicatilis]